MSDALELGSSLQSKVSAGELDARMLMAAAASRVFVGIVSSFFSQIFLSAKGRSFRMAVLLLVTVR
ncbi:hypothetical protein [Roseicyclus elongatus]|uniref:hypothetical protein n=1 Tax=Roseicyclus elongatus TaxID=159346 RepID=UPI0012EBC767|nr:hypothetical protein [Roseibacterium elongatum]